MRHIIALLLLLVSVSVQAEEPSASKAFKLGLTLCLTGPCAEDGDMAVKSINLAVNEINSAGGILGHKIETVVEDSQDAISGAFAVTALRKIQSNPEIKYVIGPSWSPGGLAVAPIVARTDIIMTSTSLGLGDFHQAGTNIFNSRGTDEQGTRLVADYCIQKKHKRFVVISSTQPWEEIQGRVFVEQLRSSQVTDILEMQINPEQSDFKAEIARILAYKPDAVFLANYIRMDLFAQGLRQVSFRGDFFAPILYEEKIRLADGALDGAIAANIVQVSPDFIEKFKTAYGQVPTGEMTAAISYDTVYLYKAAIEKAKTFETSVVAKQLLLTELNGASGTIKFDSQGGAIRTPEMMIVKNDRLVVIQK